MRCVGERLETLGRETPGRRLWPSARPTAAGWRMLRLGRAARGRGCTAQGCWTWICPRPCGHPVGQPPSITRGADAGRQLRRAEAACSLSSALLRTARRLRAVAPDAPGAAARADLRIGRALSDDRRWRLAKPARPASSAHITHRTGLAGWISRRSWPDPRRPPCALAYEAIAPDTHMPNTC